MRPGYTALIMPRMLHRLLVFSFVAAVSLSCSRDFRICDENRVERDGQCYAPCEVLDDCADSEGCIEGACRPTADFLPPTGLKLSFDDDEVVNIDDFAVLRGDCTRGLPVSVEAPGGEATELACVDGRFEYTTPTEITDGTREYRATQVASQSLSVTDSVLWTRATSAVANCIVTPAQGLTVVPEGAAVRLRWEQVDEDHAFTVIERRPKGGSWGVLDEVAAPQLDYLDVTVAADSRYEYRVREVALVLDLRCQSQASDAIEVLTLPAPVDNVRIDFEAGIRVRWNNPNPSASTVILERSVAGGEWERLPATESPFVDTPPTPNVTIEYRLAAVNASGRGPWSLESIAVGESPSLSWIGPARLGPVCELAVPAVAAGEGPWIWEALIDREAEGLTATATGVEATLADLNSGPFTVEWSVTDRSGLSSSLSKTLTLTRNSVVRAQPDAFDTGGDFDASVGAQPINPGCSECSGRRAHLVAGGGFACTLLANGMVSCWGDNTELQLGPGHPAIVVNPLRACRDADCAETLSVSNETRVAETTSVLAATACLPLGSEGALHCWGSGGYSGELGNGEGTLIALRPAPVCLASELPLCSPLSGVKQVADRDGIEPARCAVVESGEVYCWGNNAYDLVLGTGDYSVLSATRVCLAGSDATDDCVPLTNVEEMLIGTSHRCARHTDGTVTCWGWNDRGQLGSGAMEFAVLPPRPVCAPGVAWNGSQCGSSDQRLENVVQLGGGSDHTCALLADESVWCWGANTEEGFLGDGTSGDRATPGPVCASGASDGATCSGGTPLDGVVALSSSLQSHCAILQDGTARCWGSNFYGELGNGGTTASLLPRPLCADQLFDGATPVAGCSEGPMTEIGSLSLSRSNGCVVREPDAAVWCWGSGEDSALAAGEPTETDRYVPKPVCATGRLSDESCVPLTGQQRAWVNKRRGMSIGTGGRVLVWGTSRAQPRGTVLGLEPTATQPYPRVVQRLRSAPEQFAELSNVTALAAGSDHVCALDGSGVLHCWGNNDWGQLGTGDFATTGNPTVVCDDQGQSRCASAAPAMNRFVQVSANAQGTCAVDDLSHLWCWGVNDAGQLGAGVDSATVPYSAVPVLVRCGAAATSAPSDDTACSDAAQPLRGAVAASVGGSHRCVLHASGDVYCWGLGADGQLGDGSTFDSATPVRAQLPGPALQVASVGRASCALVVGGSVHCWGTNDFSELGVGDDFRFLPFSASPVPVCASGKLGQDCVPLTGVVALSGFDNTFCALENEGGVLCWGHGIGGKLGDGIQSVSHVANNPKSPCAPAPVTDSCDMSPVCENSLTPQSVAVTVGGDVACAQNELGEVLCWGSETPSRGGTSASLECYARRVCDGATCANPLSSAALRICDDIIISE